MHLFFFALSSSILAINTVAAAAAADLQSARHVLASMPKNYGLAIERRQETECSNVEPGPDVCERSCGPLFTACVLYDSCYSPSLGQTCCANAEYCPAGTYCSTLGCCINGRSLEECAADLTSGSTVTDSSVPGTRFATTPATRVVTTPLVATPSLVATTSRLQTSSLIPYSNSAVPTTSLPSVSSPTLAAATPSVSTSPNRQTSESISDLPSNTRTTAATLPRTTLSATTASNSGAKNSEDIIGLVSGLLGFLLLL